MSQAMDAGPRPPRARRRPAPQPPARPLSRQEVARRRPERELVRRIPWADDLSPVAGGGPRGAGTDRGAQRQPDRDSIRGRPLAGARGPHPGTVRPGRDAPRRRRAGQSVVTLAGPELPAAAGDRRPRFVLGQHLHAGPQGLAGPVSQAQLARGSAYGRGGAGAEKKVTVFFFQSPKRKRGRITHPSLTLRALTAITSPATKCREWRSTPGPLPARPRR